MTENLCRQCHQPTTDFLCTTCTATLKTWLLELAGHATDLSETVITRQTSRRGERVMVRGDTEKPLPFDDDAAEVAWILHNDLVAIVRDLCEQRGVAYGGVDTSSSLAAWLGRHVASIALSPDALETYGIVEHVRGLVVQAVDIFPLKAWLGRCDAVVDGRVCDHDVRANEGQTVVRCICMTDYRVDEFKVTVLLKARDFLGTGTELAAMLPSFLGKPLTKQRIGYYADSGLVRRIDAGGRTMFNLGEVVDAHQAFNDRRHGARAA